MKKLEILDCTLRDGGHHTNWFFETSFIERYFDSLTQCGVKFFELGYRKPQCSPDIEQARLGDWIHVTDSMLEKWALSFPQAHLGVMIDLKDLIEKQYSLAQHFTSSAQSPLYFIRVAAHYQQIEFLPPVIDFLKGLDYQVGVNLMRSGNTPLLTIKEGVEFLAKNCSEAIDILTLADSFGSMMPASLETIMDSISPLWSKPLGFHGHDNCQRAVQNSLVAIEKGCIRVDGSLTGMGKGAGNTPTEFLMIELAERGYPYQVESLHAMIREDLLPLKAKGGWGSDLFSYLAGKEGWHPDDLMKIKKG